MKNRQWKFLARRRFLRQATDAEKKQWRLTKEQQKAYKLDKARAKQKSFDPYERFYDLSALDAAISEKDGWDNDDEVKSHQDSNGETMQQRYERKKYKVIKKFWSPYDFKSSKSTPTLIQISQDISCKFKTLLFINCVHLAPTKNWIAFFLNAGCVFFANTIFHKLSIENFDFVDKNGMYLLQKYNI